MNRVCPQCESNTCKIEFNTLLNSIYCTKCVTRFEYSKSSRQLVAFVFSMVSFLSALVLFASESLLLALGFIVVTMTPALYLAIWRGKLKVSGLKGVRKRIREKRS